jgi:alkylation response protein AidB-like acyl-CoA dehydrogenase
MVRVVERGSMFMEVLVVAFTPDEDADQLRLYVREFFAKETPESTVRQLMESESGYDAEFWRRSAKELGLQGLGIAAESGGAGAGVMEIGVAFEEMGRALVCAPFLSTVGLAATALGQLGNSTEAAQRLGAIAEASTIATLAWAGDRPAQSTLKAAGGSVSGVAETVIDGHLADTILVAAQTADAGVGLFIVNGSAGDAIAGLTRTPLASFDPTRRIARLSFDEVAVTTLATGAEQMLERTMDITCLLLAAEQLGGTRRILETTVEYALTRAQFGRRIGSFQAVKHRCADMLVDVESARSVVYHGLYSAQHDPATTAVGAALARSLVSDAYVDAARNSLQIHGGIGFTWEHSTHLYLKRAKSSALIFGNPGMHRQRLAQLLDLAGGTR